MGGLAEIFLIYAVLAGGWWALRKGMQKLSDVSFELGAPPRTVPAGSSVPTLIPIPAASGPAIPSSHTSVITAPKNTGSATDAGPSAGGSRPDPQFAEWMRIGKDKTLLLRMIEIKKARDQGEGANVFGKDQFQRYLQQRKATDEPTPQAAPALPVMLDDARRYAKRKTADWSGESKGMRDLKGMIGLEGVKVQVELVSSLAWVDRQRKEQGMKRPANSYHMVFTGNPGTGKTTVARIVGQIFRDIGILKKGHLVEVGRKDLGGEYWGSGDLKTAEVIEKALDGVLFIDEAYALHKGHATRTGGDPLGDEIITTLLAAMENHRDRVIVIAAGYKMEMERFLGTNPGLKSRFKTIIDFPDYSPPELSEIFEKLCDENDFVLAAGAHGRAERVIEAMHAGRDPHFGNGREVRNLFESCCARQAARLRASGKTGRSDLMTFVADDIGPEPQALPRPAEAVPPLSGTWPFRQTESDPAAAQAQAEAEKALEAEQAALEKENLELMERLTALGGEVEDIEPGEIRPARKNKKR